MNYKIPDQSHLAYRKSKKVLLTLPPATVAELDWVANLEQVTRSELIRECIRRFLRSVKGNTDDAVASPAPADPDGGVICAFEKSA
jgi:hypothetical protein